MGDQYEFERFQGGYREEILKLYADRLSQYMKIFEVFYVLYEAYNIKEYPPCATNLRDAFFHFCRLYEADFIEESILQYGAIDEHLNRLLKDAVNKFLRIIAQRIEKRYGNLLKEGEREDSKVLQECLHEIKNYVLSMRHNSMRIDRVSETAVMEEFKSMMDKICNKLEHKTKLGIDYILAI